MIINVTATVYKNNESSTSFFTLDVKKLDSKTIKSKILEKLDIDNKIYDILKDELTPNDKIIDRVKYWVDIDKK